MLALLIVLVVVVAGGSVAAVEHLRNSVRSAQRREVSGLRLSISVEALSALDWQSVDQATVSPADAATAAGLIGVLDRQARGAADGRGAARRLAAAADRFRRAIRSEFALLTLGKLTQARGVDARRTDPAADTLKALMRAATLKAARIAVQQSSTADRLIVIIGVIGGLLTVGLLWRVEQGVDATRRAAALSRQATRLRDEASHDALTGLSNRRQLLRDLADVVDGERPAVLMLLDLDGFKTYNDTFGHVQGDLLLARLGKKLASAIDSGCAYRLGGDEFCALLPDDDELPASLHAISGALQEHGDSFVVTASSGVVHLPGEAGNAIAALRIADERMYHHKRGGRSSTVSQAAELARTVIAEHDLGLHEHSNGVAAVAVAIGTQLGLHDEALTDLRRVADLHDIGKVGVPRTILDATGPLNEQEWQFIHQHTLIGERILASAPALASVGRLIRSTHERYDGTGYPDQLAGEDIPLLSRIVFVCDSWDAMTGDRQPYRTRLTSEQAQAELRNGAGTQFDPTVVDAALTVIGDRSDAEPAGRHREAETPAR